MLISVSHRFIFVSGLKTASSSIEAALQDVCEVRITQSRFGKHAKLGEIERRFTSVFDLVPRRDFRVIGCIRDPADWLFSLYRSHKSVPFEDSDLSTSGMTFDEFLNVWCAAHADQCVPQHIYFQDMAGRFAADYLIRFDHLHEDFAQLLDALGVPGRPLGHENASVDLPETEEVSEVTRASIFARYPEDAILASDLAGRWIEDTDRLKISRAKPQEGYNLSEADARIRRPQVRRPVTRDDVIWAYRMLLNRDPESDAVISSHLMLNSREALRLHIMSSSEFQQNLLTT